MKREKLFKIGEVMEETGLSRQTIHNYTLAGLIQEARRTPSGHRLYDENVFDNEPEAKSDAVGMPMPQAATSGEMS